MVDCHTVRTQMLVRMRLLVILCDCWSFLVIVGHSMCYPHACRLVAAWTSHVCRLVAAWTSHAISIAAPSHTFAFICILCDTYTYMAHGIYVRVTLKYPICTYDQASSSVSWVLTRSTILSIDTSLHVPASQKILYMPHSYPYGRWDRFICDTHIYSICTYDQASSSLSWVPTRSPISSVGACHKYQICLSVR